MTGRVPWTGVAILSIESLIPEEGAFEPIPKEVNIMANLSIHNTVSDREAMARDREAYLLGLGSWSESEASRMAEAEGLSLRDEHWEVIHFLRDRFMAQGQAQSGRQVLRALEREFAGRGGKRHLYGLFPDGPVTQGSRLAGLPLPPYTVDPSFGSHE